MHIDELPHDVISNISNLLEIQNCFHEMGAKYMNFDEFALKTLLLSKKNENPIEALLLEWNSFGHTVLELFTLLYKMKQYEAMKVLKPFIETQYHHYIKEPFQTQDSEKILNGPPQNPLETRDDNITTPQKQNLLKPKKVTTASDASSIAESAGAIPKIPYEDLQKCTNNWDSSRVLGKGGFGMVFKGTWKFTQVAIKRIEKREGSPNSTYQQIVQSHTELHCLNAYRHDNILPLYGYSVGGPEPCLIYQFMSGGSLDSRLHTRDPSRLLSWPARLQIAIGTARGLQFLHTIRDKPLIHGDIKSANILLDHNISPRIGDFGLAREGPSSDYIKVTTIQGTEPYLPLEFRRGGKFSTKVDTYSFGVVLFELATGESPFSKRRSDKLLRDHVVNSCSEGRVLELKDSKVDGGEDEFQKMIDVGRKCVDMVAQKRPEMVGVLVMLEEGEG